MYRTLALSMLVAGALLQTACGSLHSVTVSRAPAPGPRAERAPGPPDHAPAHGHRRKAEHSHPRGGGEVQLVFDSALGVYAVVGLSDHYYWDGWYLRLSGDEWYASTDLGDDWSRRDQRSLPPGLAKKHSKSSARKQHEHKKHKHKKHAPAHPRW